MTKKRNIWFVVNSNKEPLLFIDDEPKKADGKWQGKYFVNSVLYNTIKELVSQSKLTEETEPQCISIDVPVPVNEKIPDIDVCYILMDKQQGTIRTFKDINDAQKFVNIDKKRFIIIKQEIE